MVTRWFLVFKSSKVEFVCWTLFFLYDTDHGRNDKSRGDVSSIIHQNRVEAKKPVTRSASFQSVTYGGINGAYYTASTSRRTGNDGVCLLHLLKLNCFDVYSILGTNTNLFVRWRGKRASKLIERQVKQHTRSPEGFMIRWERTHLCCNCMWSNLSEWVGFLSTWMDICIAGVFSDEEARFRW